jgi:hypothetical protein
MTMGRDDPFFLTRCELYSATFFLEEGDEDAVSFDVASEEVIGPLRCWSAAEARA